MSRQDASLLVGATVVRAEADVDSLQADIASGKGEISVECTKGGSAAASGMVDIMTDPLTVDVDVALDYAGCTTSRDVTIDGSLDYSQQVVVGGEDSLVYIETVVTGYAVLAGAREAECDIDITMTLDSSTGALIKAEGSACGYRADELSLSLRKNW